MRSLLKLLLLIIAMVVLAICVLTASCTTNHYFSINAEEMTNPSIEYRDSTNLTKPW